MVDDQEEDVLKSGKADHVLGSHPKIGFQYYIDDEMMKSSVICGICNKGFSSGKALGGHKRIHGKNRGVGFSKKKLTKVHPFKSSIQKKKKNKQINCAICGEVFPSIKSLSGHMRIHQNRTWRGLQPPSKVSINSSSSSFSLSDVEGPMSMDKTLISESDAANYLLMLARGDYSFTSGLTQRQKVDESESANSFFKAKSNDIDPVSQPKKKLNKTDQCSPTNYETRKTVFESGLSYGETVNTSSGLDNLEVVIKNKMKRKKVKLCDLESTQNGANNNNNNSPVTNDELFRCNTCGKSFRTFQALGGHRSSHTKIKTVIENSVDEEAYINLSKIKEHDKTLGVVDCELVEGPLNPLSQVAPLPDEASCTCKRVLDFDLNEMPSISED